MGRQNYLSVVGQEGYPSLPILSSLDCTYFNHSGIRSYLPSRYPSCYSIAASFPCDVYSSPPPSLALSCLPGRLLYRSPLSVSACQYSINGGESVKAIASKRPNYLILASLNLVTDVAILILPVPFNWRIQIQKKQIACALCGIPVWINVRYEPHCIQEAN